MPKLHLVLLPGLLNDARLWQHQTAMLSEVVQPIVGDLTGADSMAGLASSILDQAPSEYFALAGLSMGGYVAFEVFRQAPDRVVGLALLDTSARADTPSAIENRRALMEDSKENFPGVIETLLPKMVHPEHLEDESIAGTFRAMAHTVGQEAFLRQQKAIMGRPDSRPFLKEITCPTLILCGSGDEITPIGVHEEIAKGIPESELQVIERCGHLSALEQPKEITNAMRGWLKVIGAG